jgi:hypothetical protein
VSDEDKAVVEETEDEKKASAEAADEPEDEASKAEASKPDTSKAEAKPEDDRPFFARAYPRSPELEPLIVAFDRGNYALVRTDARALADKTSDARVKAAAEDLLRRTRPDSLSTALVLLALGLLVYIAITYLGHSPHEAAP